MAWMNPDQLYRKFGAERGVSSNAGEYRTNGRLREVEVKLTLANLTETETIVSDNVFLPSGAIVQEVEITPLTAAATGVAIDVGLIKKDRTTEGDYNGLLSAFPTASMDVEGEKTILYYNTTYNGALFGTPLTYSGYISASRTTSTAFTAGVIVLTIRYWVP